MLMVFAFAPQLDAPAYANDKNPANDLVAATSADGKNPANDLVAAENSDDGNPAISLVVDGAAANIEGKQGSSVYFGNYWQSSDGNDGYAVEPIKWRVLENDSTNKKLFLLSDKNLDCKTFNETNISVTWDTCTVRAWLNGYDENSNNNQQDFSPATANFKDNAFSTGEYSAVNETSIDNNNDKVFLLSDEEALNGDYGFWKYSIHDDPAREAEITDYARHQGVNEGHYPGYGNWWLRSPITYNPSAVYNYWATAVSYTGDFTGGNVRVNGDGYAVRPALNLDLGSVLFTSAAEGGKASGEVGSDALTEVGTNEGGEWKLTLKDTSGHSGFAVTGRKVNRTGVDIYYSGAKTGTDEYISAIITDKDITDSSAEIKYYGRIKNCAEDSDASGMITINALGKYENGYHLYLFNEQYNGDKKTDYSSSLQEVNLPIVCTVSFANGLGNTLKTENVIVGYPATPPADPTRDGYTFKGWGKDFSNVAEDMTVTAKWEKSPDPNPDTAATKASSKGSTSKTGDAVIPVAVVAIITAIAAGALLVARRRMD